MDTQVNVVDVNMERAKQDGPNIVRLLKIVRNNEKKVERIQEVRKNQRYSNIHEMAGKLRQAWGCK